MVHTHTQTLVTDGELGGEGGTRAGLWASATGARVQPPRKNVAHHGAAAHELDERQSPLPGPARATSYCHAVVCKQTVLGVEHCAALRLLSLLVPASASLPHVRLDVSRANTSEPSPLRLQLPAAARLHDWVLSPSCTSQERLQPPMYWDGDDAAGLQPIKAADSLFGYRTACGWSFE